MILSLIFAIGKLKSVSKHVPTTYENVGNQNWVIFILKSQNFVLNFSTFFNVFKKIARKKYLLSSNLLQIHVYCIIINYSNSLYKI